MDQLMNFPTPPLRVSRPVSACSRCRTAKIKCDGKLPSCSACEKSGRGRECSSANDQFAKGKERNYVSSLEIRVEKLERQLAEARRRKISVTMLDLDPKQAALSPTYRFISRKPKRQRKETSDVDDLVSDFGFLSVNATARDFHGFTREMSFARLVFSTSLLEPMPKAIDKTLPPRHIVIDLIQYFLSNVFALYPFLSESTIFAALDAQRDGGVYATPVDHWTVRMVVAISLASLSRKRGDERYLDATMHAAEAFKHVEKVLQPGSIVGIQVLLLLVLYAMLDPHHFNSWYLIGIASRVMVDLGLHQDLPDELPAQKSQIETRRCVYHSVYALDRAISMVHRRAFSFTDDSANVAPEVATREQVFRQALDSGKQLLRLRQLGSSTYQKLYHSDRQTMNDPWPLVAIGLSETRAWAANLPSSISKPLRTLFLSEVSYVNIVFLSAPGAANMIYECGKATIFENVVQYTETMSVMIRSLEEPAFLTSHEVLRASFVALRFLDILETGDTCLFDGNTTKSVHSVRNDLPSPARMQRSAEDMIDMAINTIVLLDRILETLCVQYGYSEPWQEFHTRSLTSLNRLQSHHERRATAVKIEPMTASFQPSPEARIPASMPPMAPAISHRVLWDALYEPDYQVPPDSRTRYDNTRGYQV